MEAAPKSEQSKSDRKWIIIRRLVHGSLSVGAVYYWLPDSLVPNFPKWMLLVIGLAIIATIEIFRFNRNKKLPWLRPYEQKRLAAQTYAAVGATIVFLVAPMQVGVAALIAMAWADPVAGELRRFGKSNRIAVLFCGITYAILAFISLAIFSVGIVMTIALTVIMTIIGVASEATDIKYLDDDFTMLVLPAVAGTLMVLAFPLPSI